MISTLNQKIIDILLDDNFIFISSLQNYDSEHLNYRKKDSKCQN